MRNPVPSQDVLHFPNAVQLCNQHRIPYSVFLLSWCMNLGGATAHAHIMVLWFSLIFEQRRATAILEMALQGAPQYHPSRDSQLCREESWERVYYPPDMDSLKPPFNNTRGCRESFYSSIKERLLSRYCDLKERYSARYTLCKEKEKEDDQRCSLIYRGYFFRSKAVILILLMNAFFSTAMCGMGTELLKFTLGSEYAFMYQTHTFLDTRWYSSAFGIRGSVSLSLE